MTASSPRPSPLREEMWPTTLGPLLGQLNLLRPFSTGRVPHFRFGRFWQQQLRVRWPVSVVLHLSHHLHASRTLLQCMPDFQQNSLSVLAPLPIPETQLLNPLRGQKPRLGKVQLSLPGQSVPKPIQFNRDSCQGAIEVQRVRAQRMLPTKFEAGESPCTQCLPKLPFLLCLLPPQPPRIPCRTHGLESRDLFI